MSKMLETKREILSRLKEERRTVTQLSEELGLSKATVSQHLSELRAAGAVEEDDNQYFRRLKYFRIKEGAAKQVWSLNRALVALAVIAVIVAIYAATLFSISPPGAPPAYVTGSNVNSTVVAPEVRTAGAAACPNLPYYSIANSTVLTDIFRGIAAGSPCYLGYLNATSSTIMVGSGVKYTAYNGTVSVPSLNYTYSLNQSQRGKLESEQNRPYCWTYSALAAFGITDQNPPARCTPSIYN